MPTHFPRGPENAAGGPAVEGMREISAGVEEIPVVLSTAGGDFCSPGVEESPGVRSTAGEGSLDSRGIPQGWDDHLYGTLRSKTETEKFSGPNNFDNFVHCVQKMKTKI